MPCRRGAARRRSTAVDASGALTRPMPMPPTMKPGSRCVQRDDGVSPCISRSATPTSAMPTPKRMRTGNARRQPSRDRRDDEREQRERQEAKPGLDRRVVELRSGCRASGRGTSRTSTDEIVNATICAPVNDGLRKSAKSNIGALLPQLDDDEARRAGRPRRRRARSSGRCPSPSRSPRSSASTSEKSPPVSNTKPSRSKPPCSSSRDSCRYAHRAERRTRSRSAG